MMKNILSILFLFIISNVSSQVPAFPGAQGGGAYTTGGRGGKVLYVTSLEDDVKIEGTLRWAINQKGARTILFKVAGIIDLKSELKINRGDVTIAGQTAPGDGICIKGYPFIISADNVIVRFLRFRMGDENGVQDDALKGNKIKNVIVDHCSVSWSTDECASFYDNENFTLQWCIISESLRNSVHKKGNHGYGGIWGGTLASFHHNLLAHHDSRNPRFAGSRWNNNPENEKIDFRNNVIYNWGSNSGYGAEGGSYNFVNNYYKPGPATLTRKGKASFRIFSPNSDAGAYNQANGVWGKFFVSGNFMFNNEKVTLNNVEGVHIDLSEGENTQLSEISSPVEFQFFNMQTQTAEKAYEDVLKYAGASYKRDKIDKRIVTEVKNGKYTFEGSGGSKNGIIDTQNDVGGWPKYKFRKCSVPRDIDEDGIPDKWEAKNGLNKKDALDGVEFKLSNNFTNLEVYLNSLVENLY